MVKIGDQQFVPDADRVQCTPEEAVDAFPKCQFLTASIFYFSQLPKQSEILNDVTVEA